MFFFTEKLKLDLDFAFEVKKLDDGELHFTLIPDEANYSFEILDKATFSADNMFVGKQDISKYSYAFKMIMYMYNCGT